MCVDSLSIMVFGKDVTKPLAIHKLQSGSSPIMVDECFDKIKKGNWKTISWPRFSTQQRVARLQGQNMLEMELGKDLMNLACRKHVLKLF